MNILSQFLKDPGQFQVEEKSLKELGKIYGGLSKKKGPDFGSGYAFIPYSTVYRLSEVSFEDLGRVQIKEGESQHPIQQGDILLTASSEILEEVGLSCLVSEKPPELCYLNSFSVGWRPDKSQIFDPQFLKYLFQSGKMRKRLQKAASGTTRYNLSRIKLGTVMIPVPPLQLQKEIVFVLNQVESLIEMLQKQKNLFSLQQRLVGDSLFKQAERDGKWLSLKDVADVRAGFFFKTSDYSQGKNRVIRISDVDRGTISDKNPKFVDDSKKEEWFRSILEENDLVISLTGDIGKAARIEKKHLPAILNQRVARIRAEDAQVQKYLFYAATRADFERDLRNLSSGAAQKNLNMKDLYGYQILLPQREMMIVINRVLDQFSELIGELEKEIAMYQEELKSLSDMIFDRL